MGNIITSAKTKFPAGYANLPETPGVYLMRDFAGQLLYIGKAANLRRRVQSYFTRPHDYRIQKLAGLVAGIAHERTDTAIEALVLESRLIKKFQPPFNVREKDDTSFWYVLMTKEKFPRLLMVRGKEAEFVKSGSLYGPFTSAGSLREAMRILRRIFLWNTHLSSEEGKFSRPCFDYQIGLCPGLCAGTLDATEYKKTARNLKLFFEGKKKRILKLLKSEMRAASKKMEYELASRLKRQVFGLTHVEDVALIRDDSVEVIGDGRGEKYRIEGYDISNISGESAVGSMVVFVGGKPAKGEYRKFKIKAVIGANDTAMLKEVLARRLGHISEWPLPDLFLIDGGLGQVNAARAALRARGLRLPVIGIMKGPDRKRNDIIGTLLPGTDKRVLIRVRDEAHRFAVKYHKQVRAGKFLQ